MRTLRLSAVLFLLFAACGAPPERVDGLVPDDVVLARVDDAVITAEEFRMNFAFGHGRLRQGPDAKEAYLRLMIYETLLAREAERRGIDTSAAVRHALRTLEEELLVERVFEAHVLDHVEVTDADVRDELARQAVRFRFRFLPALGEAHAHRLRAQVAAEGFEAARDALLAEYAELRPAVAGFESPYVRAGEIDPEVLAVLEDLPVGVPSGPIRVGGDWSVFEVVDVRRERIEATDAASAASARKVVYNRKAMEGAARFVAATMEPLGVVTDREGFEALSGALFAWYRDRPPTRNLLHYVEEQRLRTPYTRALVAAYDTPLVRFDGTVWTVRDFLDRFTPGRYGLRADDEAAFHARLADVVALVVRDDRFIERARREGLGRDPVFLRTLALWRDAWRFQELRRHLVHADTAAAGHAPVERLAETLYEAADIDIRHAVLDTLTVPASRLNPAMTVHLFKNNSNKMPLPIVDAAWR